MSVIVGAIIGGLFNGALYGVAALGLAIVFGVAGIINLAHGAFILMGMYAVYVIYTAFGIDPLLGTLLVLPLGLAFGALVQTSLLTRLMARSHESVMLVTLGIWIAIEAVLSFVFGSAPRTVQSALSGITFDVGDSSFYLSRAVLLLAGLIVVTAVVSFLRFTDTGRGIRAVSQDPVAAQLYGWSLGRTYATTMAIGTGLAFLAGGLAINVIPVSSTAATNLLLMSFVATVLGGMGNIMGTFVAGVLLGVMEGFASLHVSGSMKTLVIFVAFILILLIGKGRVLHALRSIFQKSTAREGTVANHG